MSPRSFMRPRRLAVIAIFAIVAMSAFGFAAANTVPASNAGDGQAAISGYTVTNVQYNLNASNPANLTSVQFTVAPAVPATGEVRVSLNGGTTWLPAGACNTGTNITCSTTATVLSATNLRVVAAQ